MSAGRGEVTFESRKFEKCSYGRGKLLTMYKVIWLKYEDTGDKSEWIPTSELIHTADLVSDFYIAYPIKPGPLPLF